VVSSHVRLHLICVASYFERARPVRHAKVFAFLRPRSFLVSEPARFTYEVLFTIHVDYTNHNSLVLSQSINSNCADRPSEDTLLIVAPFLVSSEAEVYRLLSIGM
jgi:hypothetical protein